MTPIGADLAGRLRNTDLPQSKFLFPMFEAVVNSIYGIDERIDVDKKFTCELASIEVKFIRTGQSSLNKKAKSDLKEIQIIDNGIGFNDDNFHSFCTMDSLYHATKGCRGVGRLLWLKEFAYAMASSIYVIKGETHKRSFKFTSKGIDNENDEKINKDVERQTIIRLCQPNKKFKDLFKKRSLENISKSLFEHCLWFYLRKGGCPRIKLYDGTEEVDMDNVYDQFLFKAKDKKEVLKIGNNKFNLLHVKVKKADDKNRVFYCAGNRVVRDDKLSIPGLYDSPLNDGTDTFYYQCYVTSEYLDGKVSPDRFSFLIPQKKEDGQSDDMFDDIVFEDIENAVCSRIEEYLKSYLKENIDKGVKRVSDYVDKKAPYYKPLLSQLDDKDKSINPTSNDKTVDSFLHSKLYEKEHHLIEEGHDILKVRNKESEEEYQKRVEEYLKDAQSLKASDLARYVVHRKIILEFLEKCINIQEDDKYSREDKIHEIIMPMHTTSDSVKFEDNNLWLIDDRLVFHHYMASDKPFNSMIINDSKSTDRPDIISEFVYDNPLLVMEKDRPPYASFSIIEFKRPMRDNYAGGEHETDPTQQCIDYVKEIRHSQKLDKFGRTLTMGDNTPAYCYIICDLTPSMIDVCKDRDLKPTYDNLGFFGYLSNHNIYFEVISFDQLLNVAKERNAAFFDKLGISHD